MYLDRTNSADTIGAFIYDDNHDDNHVELLDTNNTRCTEYYIPIKGDDMDSSNSNITKKNSCDNSDTTIRNSSTMFGALLTSLVALYVGMNRFTFLVLTTDQQQHPIGSTSSSTPSMAACTLVIVFACIRKIWNDRLVGVSNCVLMKSKSSSTTSATLTRIKSSVSVSASTSMMRLVDMATTTCSNNVLVRTLNESKNNLLEYSHHHIMKQQQHNQTPKQPIIAILNGSFVSLASSPYRINIDELSLYDMKILFQYVMLQNFLSYNGTTTTRDHFVSQIKSQYCLDTIHAMDQVVHAALLQQRQKLGQPCQYQRSVTNNDNESEKFKETEQGSSRVKTATEGSFDQCNALYFVAMVCIFAEWRTIRLVPKHNSNHQNQYKRYSIGMGLARRDLIQNASKIEVAAYQYIQEQQQLQHGNTSNNRIIQQHGPTIHELLQWEVCTKRVHGNLPKVREKSCASGLIWIYRQILYQNHIFQNIIQVGKPINPQNSICDGDDTKIRHDNHTILFPTAKSAVMAAYRTTYDAYHGFIVKQIMTSSLDAAPSNHIELLIHMIPPSSSVNRHKSQRYELDTSNSSVNNNKSNSINIVNNIDNESRTMKESVHLSREIVAVAATNSSSILCHPNDVHNNPLNKILNHCISEWMKLERFMNQCSGRKDDDHFSHRNGLIVPTNGRSTLDLSNINLYSNNIHIPPKHEPIQVVLKKDDDKCNDIDCLIRAAENDIQEFHKTIEPILHQIKTTMDRFNINDPSKC